MLYKILNADATSRNGGTGKWYLPKNGKPGKWMPLIQGDLIPCKNGYHLCEQGDLLEWLGPAIWEAEFRGDSIRHGDKTVVRQARLLHKLDTWNEETARLFACDCAERILHIFEEKFPEENRPQRGIEIARKFANGKATQKELDAARAAAKAAARDIEWNAAWDAARAAVWDAAWDAAKAAAWESARDTAWDTAWDAAKAAAREAARVADRAAAWDTAWDTAWAAAWDAERQWQVAQLIFYLGLGGKE